MKYTISVEYTRYDGDKDHKNREVIDLESKPSIGEKLVFNSSSEYKVFEIQDLWYDVRGGIITLYCKDIT